MATKYVSKSTESVGRYEYFASDISGVSLPFKQTDRDVLTSVCGKYQVVRWNIGRGDFVYDANVIDGNRVTCIAFEASSADAKRACELHAGRTARAETRSAA